jgi:acyl-homoserine-lactone acylase
MRLAIVIASFVALVNACSPPIAATSAVATTLAAPMSGSAEILWDSYGVPHIYAANRNQLAYAFGWAQMQNHADLLLRLYAQGRGRASELLGRDYLEEDRWTWTVDIPGLAARDYALQRPAMRAHIDAFVAGINEFARRHPELIGDSVRAVLPVTGVDVMANQERLALARFLTSNGRVKSETRDWQRGSNAWAIAPKRSASGHTLLLANPHLPWSDIFTWIEAQYAMPGMDVYGAALVGSPVLQIAFNDDLGWTHTVNTQDAEDLYELTLSGDGYRYDDTVRPFHERVRVLRVRDANGSMHDDTLRIRASVQGPVVATKPGKAIALRVVGMMPALPYSLEQWWEMGRAHDLAAFQRAIQPNQISGQNIIYGDRVGHVMAFYGGNSPVRTRGDRAFWAGIVPGDDSTTLWTSVHRFADMPMTLDPPSGWVQNANDPPWWSTFPVAVHPRDYPSYLASLEMALRPQRSVHLLQSDSSITYAEFLRYLHSTRMELADRLLDDLLPLANTSASEPVRLAAGVLARWDRNANADSRGAVLFTQWWNEYGRRMGARSRFSQPWSEQRPLDTPDGLADGAVAVAALEVAATNVQKLYGALDVPWGDVYRLREDSLDLPGIGASGAYGVFSVVDYQSAGNARYSAVGGDSYVAAIEFSSPIRAMTLLGYGNASRAGSPHRTDQLPLFARQQMKPVWRTRAEVEAHLERREVP